LMPDPGELGSLNAHLRHCTPTERIRWALTLGQNTFATTSMGRHGAATLHALSCEAPNLPIVWIDHGFHTQATHATARVLRERLGLNLHVFRPVLPTARIEALFGGIPTPDQTAQHQSWSLFDGLFARWNHGFGLAAFVVIKPTTAGRSTLSPLTGRVS